MTQRRSIVMLYLGFPDDTQLHHLSQSVTQSVTQTELYTRA